MVSKRLTKHFDRATTSRIPLMVIVGERELNEGLVKLKYVETSDEEINFAEVVNPLRYPYSGCFCVFLVKTSSMSNNRLRVGEEIVFIF